MGGFFLSRATNVFNFSIGTIVYNEVLLAETDFHIFVRGGWINIWGGAAACFGRGAVATPGKAKENV